jgi:carboxylesterase
MAPFDPEVVAPWRIGSGRRGALLLHGFAGTPPELRRLGDHLAAAGWRCYGPLLAGHGTTPEDLARTTWQDWADSAMTALDELRRECDRVVVAGQSGGGALALHLAAREPAIDAVACFAAPLRLRGWEDGFLPVLKRLRRWNVPGTETDLYRREGAEELWSYGRRSWGSIHELARLVATVRDELPSVRAPVLICHGERDRVIAPANAAEIERRLLCSRAVERHMFPRSGHGISVDIDRDEVQRLVAAWFDQYCPEPGEAPVPARPRRRAPGAQSPVRRSSASSA